MSNSLAWNTDLILRVIKKGKTRGRPSKYEKVCSAILSNLMRKHKKDIEAMMSDVWLYGHGCVQVDSKGRIKHTPTK